MAKRQPSLGYLGWTGFANMGDEAIHEAITRRLPGIDLLPVPLGPAAALRAATRLGSLRDSPLLLGGGTVLGRRIWRFHLHQALTLTAGAPAHMIGAGVEDPAFVRQGRLSEGRELRRWRRLLRRFERVTVRGPRSAALLGDEGIDATVVGDPALLLDPTDPLPPPESDLLGISLGTGDDLWGHDQQRVVAATAAAAGMLGRCGWRVRFLVVNPKDRADAERCAEWSGLRPDQRHVIDADEPQEFLRAVAPCQVLVAERLHAGVLAARVGVPPLMLEYQPKCRDFAQSVGLDEHVIRTDKLSAEALFEQVGEVTTHLVEVRATMARQVEELRRRLDAEAHHLRNAAS